MRIIAEYKNQKVLKNKCVYGLVVNVFGLSAYYDNIIDIDEAKDVINKIHNNNQLVYINARKIIHEYELGKVSSLLNYLEELGADYYIYSDVAFYMLAEEKNITNKLIYQVNTYMTNTSDVNIMLEENNSVVLSTEISLVELKNILKNTPKNLYIHTFGYYPIFHSRRELITNYQKYRGLDLDIKGKYDVVEELRDSHYPIEQNENGMVVYLDGAYCIDEELEELKSLHDDLYLFVLGKFLTDEEYDKVLKQYTSGDYRNIKATYPNISKGLLYEASTLLKNERGNKLE